MGVVISGRGPHRALIRAPKHRHQPQELPPTPSFASDCGLEYSFVCYLVAIAAVVYSLALLKFCPTHTQAALTSFCCSLYSVYVAEICFEIEGAFLYFTSKVFFTFEKIK
jgi:hypothetical protein